jgi:hypothetical protein
MTTAARPRTPRTSRSSRQREAHLAEFQRQAAMDRFRDEKPQMWLQHLRVLRVVEVQEGLPGGAFPAGACFLHGNLVSTQHFCVKRISGVDLDTCQVTVEIYGDEDLEEGVVVLPLEAIEWFGFPAKAVPVGIHFEGFTGKPRSDQAPA